MEDIVERLRSRADYEEHGAEIGEAIRRMGEDMGELLCTAAEEIERLRNLLKENRQSPSTR